MGACTALGLAYSPSVHAVSPSLMAQAVQQAKKVTGHIVDADGPVIGASVVEKGNPKNGAVTDLDGNFTLNVKPGATLVVSYIGYKTQEVAVGNKSDFAITLKTDDKTLDDVVVVGYGVQKKKLVTGATVEVKGDDIQKMNTTQVLGALQSKTPGVNIQANSGQPGDGFKISIRGAGTNGSTTPLYIIDGVAGDINNLNPADIDRIDVLKDAASCANLVGRLVLGAEAVLVGLVGIIDRQEATPGPGAGIVVDLSAVDKILDGLNLNVGVGIKVLADALVVATLTIDELVNGVERVRVVVLPAFCTRSLDVIPVEVVAVLVVDGHARVSTHHGGESIGVLVANLNTLTLLMTIIDVFTNLHHVKPLVGAIDDMVGVHAESETTEV